MLRQKPQRQIEGLNLRNTLNYSFVYIRHQYPLLEKEVREQREKGRIVSSFSLPLASCLFVENHILLIIGWNTSKQNQFQVILNFTWGAVFQIY